jgi:hypothetical protein
MIVGTWNSKFPILYLLLYSTLAYVNQPKPLVAIEGYYMVVITNTCVNIMDKQRGILASMLGRKCKGAYSMGLHTTTSASCSIFLRCRYVFVSCGPYLRCKPCPDEITVTAINMGRWEGSVSSLKII